MRPRKNQSLTASIRAMLQTHHIRSVHLRISALLALIIAGVTVFNLVLPAITLTSDSDSELIRQIELTENTGETPPEEGEPAETEEGAEALSETGEEDETVLFPEEEPVKDEGPACPAQLLTAMTDSFLLYADAEEGALPENSMIVPCAVPWVLPEGASAPEGRILDVRAVSVAFCDAEGGEIQPFAPVKLYLRPLFLSGVGTPAVYRVDASGLTPAAGAASAGGPLSETGDFVLWADPSAVYAVAETVPCAYAAAGACSITAFWGQDTGLPGNAQLSVREILPGDADYAACLADAAAALGTEDAAPALLFALDFLADGQWAAPAGDVSLELRLPGSAPGGYSVVRLAGEASHPAEWVGAEETGGETVLSFTTGGASVFGVFTLTDPAAEDTETGTDPADEGTDPETDPVGERADPETDPVGENADPETDPADETADTETDPADETTDTETDPADVGPDPETDPDDETADPETDPADGETGVEAGSEEPAYPARKFTGVSGSIRVSVEAPEGAFPAGTVMTVNAISSEDVLDAVSGAVEGRIVGLQAVDIIFLGPDGLEIEPLVPVRVTMGSADIAEADASLVVHVDREGEAVVMEQAAPEGTEGEPADEIIFEAGGFSVYVLVYTVDFVYEIDGQEYAFSIPGGGCVTLRGLAERLGIGESVNVTDLEQFIADVDRVEFSSPALVWAGRAEEDCTVGEWKTACGLESVYSAELTEEEIAAINGAAVSAGEWLLISLQPFSGAETLTVTMKDGEVWTVLVTDAQISTNVLTADGMTFVITVTYGDDAELPEGTKLIAEEILPEAEEYIQYLGRTWLEVNREYLAQAERQRLPGLDDTADVRPVNIDAARFFDLTFLYAGAELEPRAPVQVDIRLADGLRNDAAEPVVGVVHFPAAEVRGAKGPGEAGSGVRTELIPEFETAENPEGGIVEFTYAQESFSVVGTYIGQKTYEAGYAPMDPAITLPKLMANRDGGSAPPLAPLEAEKALTPDMVDGHPDDTYTLALSVKGDEEYFQQTTKANVLIVMDRSSSMNKGVEGAAVPFSGTPQSGHTYYGIINGELQALNHTTSDLGTTTWTYTDTAGTTTTYTGTVYESSSRFQAERAALDELITALTSKNVTDPSDPEYAEKHDLIEVKICGFASTSNRAGGDLDGQGTESAWSTDKDTLMATVNNDYMNNGTNWEDALIYAKETADAMKQAQPGEDVYIIFLTDGEPTAVYGERMVNGYGANHYDQVDENTGSVDLIHDLHNGTVYHNNSDGQGGFIYAFNYALNGHAAHPNPSQAIVDAGHKLYGIFTFNPGAAQTGYLARLVNNAYGMGDTEAHTPTLGAYYTNARDIAELRQSFDNIFTTIFDSLAYGDVKIVDGLTVDAMTTTIFDGATDGMRYKVTDAGGNEVYSVTTSGSSSDPTVTFHFYGSDYTYTPGATNSPAHKVTTYTYSVTDPENPDGIVTTTYVKTEGGADTTVEKQVTRSVPVTEGGVVTGYRTVSTASAASSLAELNADPNAADPKTYYSLNIGGLELRMSLAETVTSGTGDDAVRTLTWDLSPIGSLAKGYTYTAEFTVWPNQGAFDYVAGLNNGLDGFYWDDSIAEAFPPAPEEPEYFKGGVAEYPSIVYRYPDGPYSVLTNTMQEVRYTVVHSQSDGDVMTTTTEPHTEELEPPEPMDLTGTKIGVIKEWNDTLDPAPLRKLIEDAGFNAAGQPNFHITMRVNRFTPLPLPDGSWVEYTSFDFYPRRVTDPHTGENTYVWDPQELSIAPGIMVTTHPGGATPYPTAVLDGVTYYILETGHDYQIEEVPLENSYNFEFKADPYHPMLVDGLMKNITLTEDSGNPGHYLAEEIVDPNTSSAGDSMTSTFIFRGSNNLRSGLNIIKKVQDKSGADMDDDTTFYVRLYAQDKDGNQLTYSPPQQGGMTEEEYQHTLQDYDNAYPIWYKTFSGYSISSGGNYQGVTDPEVTCDGSSCSWPDGEVKAIKAGSLLQLINIPYGTRIKVVEVDPIYDDSDPPQITGYTDIGVGDRNNSDYRLHSIVGDVVVNADADGYTSIGFDTSYEIIITNRHTSRIGDIIAEKKWYKADGTEYTGEELAALGAETTVTGELWRSYTATDETGPMVTLMATYNRGAGGPVQLWSGRVQSGSSLQFSVAIDATSNPAVTASSGASVPRQTGVSVGQYDGANVYKETANAFTLSNITEDVTITAAFTQDDSNIGYKILQSTPSPTGSITVSEQVSSFTLSSANGWRRVWTPAELAEAEDIEYTYEFRNVAETDLPSGFYFDDTPTAVSDGSGNMIYTFTNARERKTELVVRKVWAGGGTPAGAVTYKLQRTGYAADGTVAEATADHGSDTFTLSASVTDHGVAWQYRHATLPADNNKWPDAPGYIRYEYSVVETPVPAGYIATYYDVTENGETIRVIRNTPEENNSVQVRKLWQDGAGNPLTSGIPEGAYITGSLERDYTGPRAVTVTVHRRATEWNSGNPYTYGDVSSGDTEVWPKVWQIPEGASLNIWTRNGNGDAPSSFQRTVSGQTSTITATGAYNSENSSLGRAYVITANTDMEITIDYGYYGHGAALVYSFSGGDTNGVSGSEDMGAFTLNAENGWTWSWTDLNEAPLMTYTYRLTDVEEHTADGSVVPHYDGFNAPEIGVLTQGENNSWSGSITNVRLNSVQLVKIDEATRSWPNPKKLPGARFRLLRYDGSTYVPYTENGYGAETGAAVGTDGTLLFADLPDGRYKIMEVSPPNGYIIAVNNDIYFDILNGSVERYDRAYGEDGRTVIAAGALVSAVSQEVTEGETAFIVGNASGSMLPSTGGAGTALCPVLGGLLALCSGGMLLVRRRRNG